jgi:iron(III) transport system ATP-binding protein
MLDVQSLRKAYRPTGDAASPGGLHDASLTLRAGEFLALLGPRRAGKTALLRCIAGLDRPDGGLVRLAGEIVYADTPPIAVPPERRDIAFVFQSDALWPHMTVAETIGFPMQALRVPAPEARERVDAALAAVGLQELASRRARTLSPEQRQRLGIARAIVRKPKLLLLDEPLSEVDAAMRHRIQDELYDLPTRYGCTVIYATRDQEAAMGLADRVALMHDGRIVDVGTPETLYLRPRSVVAARVLGAAPVMPCTVREWKGAGAFLDTPLGPLLSQCIDPHAAAPLSLMVRPEHIAFDDGIGGDDGFVFLNRLHGLIRSARFSGGIVEYGVEVNGHLLPVRALSGTLRAVGANVALTIPPARCVVLSDQTD